MNENLSDPAEAVPLTILPGLICDSRMFADSLAALPECSVIDGFYGGADRLAAMADYALARMPERSAVLGHSMGARVALELIRRAPARVTRLALVDTGIHGVRPGERAARYRLRDLGRDQGAAALVASWLPPMVGSRARADAALMQRLTEMACDAGPAIFAAQTEALLHRPSVATLLPHIACPTLVAVGREDCWSPVAQHEDIAAAIAGARLRVVEDAGHMMPAEAPSAFCRIVREWLAWPAH